MGIIRNENAFVKAFETVGSETRALVRAVFKLQNMLEWEQIIKICEKNPAAANQLLVGVKPDTYLTQKENLPTAIPHQYVAIGRAAYNYGLAVKKATGYKILNWIDDPKDEKVMADLGREVMSLEYFS